LLDALLKYAFELPETVNEEDIYKAVNFPSTESQFMINDVDSMLPQHDLSKFF